MTPEQRNSILGIVAGWSGVTAVLSFFGFVFVADNLKQALVYTAGTFILIFAALRFWYFRRWQ